MGTKAVLLTCLLTACSLVSHAQETDLSGTRRGPTGFFLTIKEREALRERVRNEGWAKEYFEKEILPACEKPNGFYKGDPMALAIAYVVTGDRAYAHRVRDMMLYQMNWWYNIPDVEKWGEGKTRPRINYGWNAYLPSWIPQAYDLIADALPPKDELFIRGGIKNQIECALNYYRNYWISTYNMKMCSTGNMLPWACAIGDDEFIKWFVDHKPDVPGGAKKHGGFVWLMDAYIRDGNRPLHFGVETQAYSWIFGLVLPNIADVMRRYEGRDFYKFKSSTGATIKGFLDGVIATAYPVEKMGLGKGTIRVANWGHASTGWGKEAGDVFLVNDPWGDGRSVYTGALRRLGRAYPEDRKYRWLLSLLPESDKPNRDDLLFGRLKGVSRIQPPPAPSTLFPESGIAMLRSPETPEYWNNGIAAFLHGGEISRGHIGDPMMMLFGAGRLLYPEWCTTNYEHQGAAVVSWTMRRISANTIVIDGRDGLWSSSVHRHSFDPEVKFASVRCHPYLEAEAERALMLTNEYLLDITGAHVLPEPADRGEFDPLGGSVCWDYNASLSEDLIVHPGQHRYDAFWRARKMPESHTFDYMLHGLGRQFPDSPDLYRKSAEFAKSYWPSRWVENERKRGTADGFLVDWVQTSSGLRTSVPGRNRWRLLGDEWYRGRAGVRMRMLGEKGTSVFLGEGPMRWGPVDRDLHPEEVIPLVAVRRTGKEALFVALHEPYKKSPAIRSFSYVCKPKASDANPVVGVEVKAPDYTDKLFVCLGLDGLKVPQKGTKLEALLAGKHELADLTRGWLFQVDPQQVGDAKGWAAPSFKRDGWTKVSVEADWQNFRPGYYGTAWYARTFTVPSAAGARKPQLFFVGADQDAWVYVNGEFVFEHHDWAEPFFINLAGKVKYDAENLVVVKVRKLQNASGLYGGVKLVSGDGSDKTRATGASAVPLVTAQSEVDPAEVVRFKGQAYFRVAGDTMRVRGDVESFSLAAPGVEEVILNGQKVKFNKRGSYVLYGNAPVPRGKPMVTLRPLETTTLFPGGGVRVEVEVRNASGEVKLNAPKGLEVTRERPGRFLVKARRDCAVASELRLTAAAGGSMSPPLLLRVASPVALSLPQHYVNLDAEKGGRLVVRVENVSSEPVSGRLVLGESPGLKATASEAQVQSLGPGEKREVAFELRADAKLDGKLVPAAVRFILQAGSETCRTDTKVAVGVAVQEVKDRYTDRVRRNKYQTDVYDRFLVRAPGYSIEIDKTSGASRWVMDPEGKVRTSLGWYPFRKMRGRIAHVFRKNDSKEIPTVWTTRERKKVFGWDREAQFVAQGKGAGGEPAFTFRSADKDVLVWHFFPDRVEVEASDAEGKKLVRVDFSRLDIEEREYAHRIRTSRTGFSFHRAPSTMAPRPKAKAPLAGEPVNVIKNGTFAQLVPDKNHPSGKFPSGWRLLTPRQRPIHCPGVKLDEETCLSGGRSLKLDLEKLRGVKAVLQQTGIPVKAYHRYRMKIRMRHEEVRATPGREPRAASKGVHRVYFKAPGANYSTHGIHPQYNPSCWPNGARDWFVIEFNWGLIGEPNTRWGTITTDGTMLIQLNLPGYADQSGTLWIDEIICEELDDPTIAQWHCP